MDQPMELNPLSMFQKKLSNNALLSIHPIYKVACCVRLCVRACVRACVRRRFGSIFYGRTGHRDNWLLELATQQKTWLQVLEYV
jgi:hypothetical protein